MLLKKDLLPTGRAREAGLDQAQRTYDCSAKNRRDWEA
jgi:hypothetical protein